jgi:hypothetical protein
MVQTQVQLVQQAPRQNQVIQRGNWNPNNNASRYGIRASFRT